MAGQPFKSITDLLEDIFGSHSEKETNAQILKAVNAALDLLRAKDDQTQVIIEALSDIKADQGILKSAIGIVQADLLSIKTFLGIPDVRIGATQEQLDALGDRITGQTEVIKSADETFKPPAQ